jgi:membrane fusion protein, heavy metal efflux system
VEIDARLGDEVQQGQILFKVRSSDIAGAFSDYRKAVKNEELAKVQLQRAQLLFDNGAIAKSMLEIAQNAEDNAKVDLETTQEHLRLLGSDPDHPTGIVEVPAPGGGCDYRSADQHRVRRAGADAAQSVHHFGRVARLDCVRRVRKRSGAGAGWGNTRISA